MANLDSYWLALRSAGPLSSMNVVAQSAEEAKQANLERYKQGLSIYDEIISRYQPGGGFGEGALAQYELGKEKAMAKGMQSLVSSGLSNTTVAAGLPLAYEQEVGTPFRLQLEDMRMNALTQAQVGKAGFIERRQDIYPDVGTMAQLAQQAGAAGGGGLIYQPRPSETGSRYFGGEGSIGGASSGLNLDFGTTAGGGTTSQTGSNWTFGSQWTPAMNNPYYTPIGTGGSGTPLSEDEYQQLLQQNLARNQQFDTGQQTQDVIKLRSPNGKINTFSATDPKAQKAVQNLMSQGWTKVS